MLRSLSFKRFLCPSLISRVKGWLRSFCLPVLSLSRSPRGGHLEWMAACCDPFFDYCERSVWLIGMFCFILVIFGISLVVFTFYTYMVPFLYKTESGPIFTFYFIYGHYLLINITFHYFKGVYTDPGKSIKGSGVKLTDLQIKNGWKTCYKCDARKPPRAHHCRICGKCVFKMDHHCPWMFNCIGQYNHRHFMLFIIFMWLGVCYVVHCCWTRVIAGMQLDTGFLKSIFDTLGMSASIERARQYPLDHRGQESFLVIVVFFICFGVTIALLLLGGWNMYLVGRGETAIEFYTNKRDAVDYKHAGKKFVNPYNHGFKKNWYLFLGLNSRRSFFCHVLLPSGHAPIEDGMEWLRCNGSPTSNGLASSNV